MIQNAFSMLMDIRRLVPSPSERPLSFALALTRAFIGCGLFLLSPDALALDPLRAADKEIPYLLGLGDPNEFLSFESRPTTQSVELGRFLFFDKRLSGDGTIACSSCHLPSRAFTDGKAVSIGINGQRGHRNAPTIVNRLYGRSFFWDGRAHTLTEQSLEPFISPVEHGLSQIERTVFDKCSLLQRFPQFNCDIGNLGLSVGSTVFHPFCLFQQSFGTNLSHLARTSIESGSHVSDENTVPEPSSSEDNAAHKKQK